MIIKNGCLDRKRFQFNAISEHNSTYNCHKLFVRKNIIDFMIHFTFRIPMESIYIRMKRVTFDLQEPWSIESVRSNNSIQFFHFYFLIQFIGSHSKQLIYHRLKCWTKLNWTCVSFLHSNNFNRYQRIDSWSKIW